MARIGDHYYHRARAVFFVAESAIVTAAAYLAWRSLARADVSRALPAALACAAAVQAAFYLADLYDLHVARADARRSRRLLGALGLVATGAMPAAWAAPLDERLAVVAAIAAATSGAAALRAAVPFATLLHRVFLVGGGEALVALRRELEHPADDVIVGACDPASPDLLARVRASGADTVVVASSDRRGLAPETLLACRLAGLEVLEGAAYVERSRRKLAIDLLSPSDLIYEDGFRRSRPAEAGRRILSLGGALLLAAAAAPLAAVIGAAIRLDSPGPVLFRQERVGRGGRGYTMWKFRTMRVDAEANGAAWAAERDPRVTRVGHLLRRLRLDELPQLVNVLAGDMDLVGPRPERPEFVAALQRELPYYGVRALVRPGLTGWAQIRFRYGASTDDAKHKLGYDLYYVKRASPLLDAIILFHTAKVVLTGKGAR